MLTQKGHARRKLLASTAQSALLYYPLSRMFRDSEALAQSAAAPCAVFAYFPTGYKDGTFWPGGGSGPISNFPAVIKPIEELGLKDDFLLLDGLDLYGSCNHNGGLTQTFAGWGGAGLWEGAGIKYQNNPIDGATLTQMMPRPYSLDQILADKWGANSVVLGVASRMAAFPDPISWKKDGVKNRAEDNPQVTFDRYFGNFMPGAGGSNGNAEAAKKVAAAEKRVIDYLVSDIKRIESQLGSEDKLAFQSHVAAIDDINSELNKIIKEGSTQEPSMICKPGTLPVQFGTEREWFLKEDKDNLANIFKLQRHLIVQIMACGIARIAVWQIGGGHTTTQSRAEGVSVKNEDHHQMSHAGGKAYEEVQAGHIREIGKLALELKTHKVGGKSLLDNTLVYTASDSGDTGHFPNRVPSFFLGNLGGKFKSGRQIKFNGKAYNHALITAAHLLGATDINQVGNTRNSGPLDEVLRG